MAAEGLVHWDQVGLCEVGMSQLPRKIEIFNTCLKITCGVLRMLLGHGAVQSGPSLFLFSQPWQLNLVQGTPQYRAMPFFVCFHS
jgi:hypothetical protein